MKKSNQVILSAVFIASVSSFRAEGQVVGDTMRAKEQSKGVEASMNDSNAYYQDTTNLNQVPPQYETEVYVGWRRHRFFRVFVDFFGYRHFHHRTNGKPRQSVVNSGGNAYGTVAKRNNLRTANPVGTPVTKNTPRTGGFGNTMKKTNSSVHS